jgi:acyl-CoA synthetase (AMP-forming)/AMP-acid ligase II
MLTVMPLFHAMGTGLSLQALYNGAAVAVYSMPDPGSLLKLIARDRPTILPLVPTVIQMLLDHPDAASADYSSVRIVVYAGSPIGSHTLERAIRAMKCDFMQFYGATETGAGVTFLRPQQHRLDDQSKLKSCGSVLPLIDIKVADSKGNEVPVGQVGEFLIRSPSITTGYFNQPETTAAAFRDGWYRSGDAGYQDAEGFLYIVDRVKDMIISGGENVYSTEVEQALQQLSGVQMCAVVGLPDDRWGERVVAAIVADPSAGLSSDAVIAHCRRLIAGYKVPKQIEFVQALPMTPTGKVKKRELRDQFLKSD